MDKTFEKFLRRNIDLAPVGVIRREDNEPYFCTPKGASIFGWAGVDGIHFCFVRGFGGTVFAVSPMNTGTSFIHPVAGSFEDFLRLLLACGDSAAIEQAWMWDEPEFDQFLRENQPGEEAASVLSRLADSLNLTPMERPWAYIKELQAAFDYSKLKYTREFYDTVGDISTEHEPPEWKVYFTGGGRAGTEISVGREFEWAGHRWVVPSVYVCGKGMVADICMETDPGDIRRFTQKWDLDRDTFGSLTREQQKRIEQENPLGLGFNPTLELNGKELKTSSGCCYCFYPHPPEGTRADESATEIVNHYGLNRNMAWNLWRYYFLWGSGRRREVKSLTLMMEASPLTVWGPRFRTEKPGDSVTFTHPVTGTEHTLTVTSLEKTTLSEKPLENHGRIYPNNIVTMRYTLTPETSETIHITDCGTGDKPRRKARSGGSGSTSTGIIGGADGPLALVVRSDNRDSELTAYSALYFDLPKEGIEWRPEFRVTPFVGTTVKLI